MNQPTSLLRTTLLCLLSLLSLTVTAQEGSIDYQSVKDQENYGRFRVIEVRGHTGMHLYGGEGLDDELDSGYGAFEVRYGWQTDESDQWAAYYGYPSFGFGFYSGFVGDPQVFGNPNAVYGWMNFPISSGERKNVFSINPAFGLTYNLEPFDPETNPLNDAIGARMAVYFNLAFEFGLKVTREIDMTYGIDFTHFSNGRSFAPNWGLNMFGVNLGMLYHYNADQRKVDKDPYTDKILQSRFRRSPAKTPEKIGEHSIETYLAIGTVQNDEDAGTDNRYTTFSGVVDYVYRFDTIHGVSVGFDYFYDESLSFFFPDDDSKQHLFGMHAGYDFHFWRMLIRLQVGAYLHDDRMKDPVFLRPALRYNINDWMFAQVGLKTKNGAAADWVEWGIGFRPFKW